MKRYTKKSYLLTTEERKMKCDKNMNNYNYFLIAALPSL